MKKALSYLSLFFSFGTLICCALPALLVVLGLGASLAGLVGAFPQIVWLSENKGIVFLLAGLMIVASVLSHKYSKNITCPVGELEEQCKTSKSISDYLVVISIIIYLIGAFFAFVAPLLV